MLRSAAIRGSRWGAVSGVLEQLATTGTTVVLVRLLTPADFGIVAAATVAVGLFSLLTRFGFGAALVNHRDLDERVASTTFWLALGVGLLATGGATAFAPLLAGFVGKPEAAPYIAVASLTIVTGLLANVSQALLLRRLRFRAVYVADMLSVLAYAAVAISLAAATALGAWAIILGRVASAGLGMAVLLLLARWRPRLVFDLAAVRPDLRFNSGFLGTQLTGFVSKNADYWVIGRTASASALGVYYVAYVLPNLLRQRMTWLTTEVLFPVLSRMRDDREALVRTYRDVLRLLAFVGLPALLGVAVVADLIVAVFFGPQWSDAAPPMSILAVAAAVEIPTQLASTLFLSLGTPGRSVTVNVSRLLALAAGLGVAVVAGGLDAVAWAVLASTLVAAVVAQRLLGADLAAGPRLLLATLTPVLVPALAMVAAVAGARLLVNGPAVADLALLVALGGLVYLGAGLALSPVTFRGLLRQLRELVRS